MKRAHPARDAGPRKKGKAVSESAPASAEELDLEDSEDESEAEAVRKAIRHVAGTTNSNLLRALFYALALGPISLLSNIQLCRDNCNPFSLTELSAVSVQIYIMF